MSTRHPQRVWAHLGLFAGLGVLALVFQRCLLLAAYESFGSLLLADDDGYFLLTLVQFEAHGALYEATHSSYGPFLYLCHSALHALLGLPLTHAGLRWLSLGELALASLLVAAFVFRLTRSRLLTALVLAQLFVGLEETCREPGHPQWLLLTLLGGALLATSRVSTAPLALPRPQLARRAVEAWPWLLIGFCAGAATFTKVNVGAFVLLSAALGAVVCAPPGRLRTALLRAGGAAALLLPSVLLNAKLSVDWCRLYALLVTGSAGCVLLSLANWPARRTHVPLERLAFGAVGLALAVGLSTACALATGTSPYGLLDGMILGPLRHSDALTIPLELSQEARLALVAAGGLLVTIHGLPAGAPRRTILALAKAAVGLGLVLSWESPAEERLSLALPFVWLVTVPPRRAASWGLRQGLSRSVLALLTILHALVAYPIAGTQVHLAALLLSPVAALLLADVHEASREWRALSPASKQVTMVAVLAVATSGLALRLWRLPQRATYERSWPLALPGTQGLRVSLERAATLHWVVNNLRAHADTFLGYPGQNSLYPWTDLPPPTGWNTTTWMTIFDDARQEQIAERLRAAERPLVVELMPEIWLLGRDDSSEPLVRFVRDEFVPWARCWEYELLLRSDRDAAELDTYVLFGAHDVSADVDPLPFPWGHLSPQRAGVSVELWFLAEGPGVLLGLVDGAPGYLPSRAQPLAYVGLDGHLHAQLRDLPPRPLRSPGGVVDGGWHHLVIRANGQTETLYLDGEPVAQAPAGRLASFDAGCLGTGWAQGWPAAADGWFPLAGALRDVRVHLRPLDEAEIRTRARSP
jgi:hypothetical protein